MPDTTHPNRTTKFYKVPDGLRVPGVGEITKPLTIQANHFTATAREKIEAAGGTAEVI